MHVRVLPNDDRSCGWHAMLPPPKPARHLTGQQNADWVVLGAGFTGLSAARRLAEHLPGSRVVLLEAQGVGFGASGRNSGFLVDVGHYEERLGAEGNQRQIRLARAGIEDIRQIVRKHGIDCAWSEKGRLHGAVEDVGMRCLEHFCQGMDKIGEPYELLDREAVAAITGTGYYRAAARTPGAVSVQPAALVRGLAAALPPTIELFEDSPVREVRQGSVIHLACPEGSVDTKHLLLASNGFTPALGFLKRRVFPMLTFASVTRALRDDEKSALGGDPEWGLVPEERMGSTVRRLRDQRILIRNSVIYDRGVRIADSERRAVRQNHLNSFRARFPALRDVELEYTWGGVMGMSLNNAHFFGRVTPGVFASAAYNGVGVAMGAISGRLLADLAVGSESQSLRDIQTLPGPAWIPPDPLLGLGVRVTTRWLRARAGAER